MTAIADTIPVAISTGSTGASHTGWGVYEYSFSMRGGFQNMGVSRHLTAASLKNLNLEETSIVAVS